MKRITVILVAIVAVVAAGVWWVASGRAGDTLAGQPAISNLMSDLGIGRIAAGLDATGAASISEQAVIRGSGTIEAELLVITSEMGGRIVSVLVGEGDEVAVEQLLIELDASDIIAQSVQVESLVATARAHLAKVRSGPRDEHVAAAEAELNRAMVAAEAAEETCEQAKNLVAHPQEIQIELQVMRGELAAAEKDVEMAGTQLKETQIQRDEANRSQDGDAALIEQQIAQKQVEAAEIDVKTAEAYRDGLAAQIERLEAMRDYPVQLIVNANQACSALNLALAGIEVAEAHLAATQAGPRPEDVAVAESQLREAEAALKRIGATLDKLILKAPHDGVVREQPANVGELAAPGAVLMTLADLDEVELRVFIPEAQIGRVREGHAARVRVDAYPGQVFEGTVAYISPRAEFTPKNVQTQEERVNLVFAVKIRLDNADHRLKPGMPADAEILSPL